MNEERIQKDIFVTREEKVAVWTRTARVIDGAKRSSYGCIVCDAQGVKPDVITTTTEYVRTNRLVPIKETDMFIEATHSIHGSKVTVYTIESIEPEERKMTLLKVASLEDTIWTNYDKVRHLKPVITSILNKAKKYYSSMDIQ